MLPTGGSVTVLDEIIAGVREDLRERQAKTDSRRAAADGPAASVRSFHR